MELSQYARRPFIIEAVQVTKRNIDQIAKDFGVGTVEKTRKHIPFIQTDPKVVPHVKRVYPGWWFTRTEGGQIRFYAKRVFQEQFTIYDDATHFALQSYMRVEPEEEETEGIIAPEGATSLSKANPAIGHTVKSNIFTDEIPAGGTYIPGRLSAPPAVEGGRSPAEIDTEHEVGEEIHEKDPLRAPDQDALKDQVEVSEP